MSIKNFFTIICHYRNEYCKVTSVPQSDHRHYAVRIIGDDWKSITERPDRSGEYFSTDLQACIRYADKKAKELKERGAWVYTADEERYLRES